MKMDLISLDKKVCLLVFKLNFINLLERFVVFFMERGEKKINVYFRYSNNIKEYIFLYCDFNNLC